MSNVPNRTPNLITAAGAVTPSYLNPITAAGAVALTLAAPTIDGQEVNFIDEGGHAHTVVISAVGSPPTAGLNGGGVTTATFNGTKGSALSLVSRNGSWWTAVTIGITLS